MGSLRKRYAVMKLVGIKMLEEGKVLSKHQYDRCSKVPIRSAEALRQFGNWPRLVDSLRTSFPDLWKEINSFSKVPEIQNVDKLAALSAKSTRAA